MTQRFSYEWLKQQILRDGNVEVEAGMPLMDSSPIRRFASPTDVQYEVPKDTPRKPLQMLIHQIRRRDGLSVVQFADKIRVDPAEITSIESDPQFTPRPRTIHQLADYLKVPAPAVQSLTPDAVANDDGLREAATRFAASSDDLSSLSKAERKSLNNFVKALASYDKAK
ncbi:helix-turn-helix domain-containing protein [Rhizobium rhizogenes]|uniref:helix-turn-helix domain-containing protein n=1 Tax=Rhizobium rhizogenes TaxID=359 RepID=UPI001571C918|nr:helix-turn-helix transcriptional regulator [Rhizobium rhizogenes]NTG08852.1 helix-turn-helix transcriptional regulator [Rhizobium rhizogenes]